MLRNKRLLIGILAMLLLISMPVMVRAVEAKETTKTSTGVDVKWSYTLDGNNIKDLKCTNISAITGELEIPSTIDGYNVTSLGSSTFSGAAGLRKVTIPNTVTSIGTSSFNNCTGLTNITIPDSVTSIGQRAFMGCTGLKNAVISKNLSKLNDYAFSGCDGITEIILPENLTTIGYCALKCGGLKFIKIPENVVSIDKEAFGYSWEEKDLTIYGKEGSTAQAYAKENNVSFEKIENWDKRNQNSGADITAPTVKSMYFDYSDVMTYWEKTTNDYRIPRGIELPFIVQFTETIKGTEVPTLTIKCGEGANIELKNGTITGDKIVYTYKIKKEDEGLITVVKLEGGNVSDDSGNKAVLSVKEIKAQFGNYVYANGSVAASTTNNGGDTTNTNSSNTSSNASNNSSSSSTKSNSATTKDNTIATKVLPYTGKVILMWIIGIVTVSAIIAHIRYKKLYIK